MYKKKRLFWSFDIVKTERWLDEMSRQGKVLDKINFITRNFIFKEEAPMDYHYRLVYKKNSKGSVPNRLTEGGYELVTSNKNIYTLKSDCDTEVKPRYTNFLLRNRKIKYACIFALSALSGLYFPTLLLLLISLFSETVRVMIRSFNGSILGAVSFWAIFTLLPIWLIYCLFKINKTNKELELLELLCGDKLNLSFTIPKKLLLSKKEEMKLKKEGLLFKKTRIAWQYAPDIAENWLTAMALKGFVLYRLTKIGNSFLFMKGDPKKIKYVVDYQNQTTPEYFNINVEDGWILLFTSISRNMTYIVWSKEYEEEEPMFYSDTPSKLKQAKRLAITFSVTFFPLSILFIIMIIVNITFLDTISLITNINMIMYAILACELGFFALRTILYYRRVKKMLKSGF